MMMGNYMVQKTKTDMKLRTRPNKKVFTGKLNKNLNLVFSR